MHFVKALIGLAVATVSASKLSSDVSFTNQPEDISIGKPFTIRYKALDMDQVSCSYHVFSLQVADRQEACKDHSSSWST